ncbi:MAG: GGDEF domain-containing protein [Candidatus Gottesmanbacteria bacterium]
MSDSTIEIPSDIEAEHDAWAAAIIKDPNEDRLRPDYHPDNYVRLLEKRAAVDVLTGVGTRRLLDERMEQLLNDDVRNIGFLFIDGNGFGKINKALSQEYGDEYVRQTARLLTKNLDDKKSETFRPGGDEFVVLLKDIHSNEELDEVGNRLAKIFSGGNYKTDGGVIPTVSIGGLFVNPDMTKDQLERSITGANIAMKYAKAHSKVEKPVQTEFKQQDKASIFLEFPPTDYVHFQESMHGVLASLPRPKPFIAK